MAFSLMQVSSNIGGSSLGQAQDAQIGPEARALSLDESIALQWQALERGELVDISNFDSIFQEHHWECLVSQLSSQVTADTFREKAIETDGFGGHVLPVSHERQLITLGFKYFQTVASAELGIVRARKYSSRLESLQAYTQTRDKISAARDRFLTFVPGVRLIQEVNCDLPDRCHNFAFDYQRWCNNPHNRDWFWHLPDTVGLLEKNNYHLVETPQMGDVIAYYDDDFLIKHYGKVTAINEEGKISITSKFGDGHIYEHCEDSILPEYGDRKVYFRYREPLA